MRTIKINRNLNGSVENANLWSVKFGKEPMTWTHQGILRDVKVQHPSIRNCAFLSCVEGFDDAFKAEVEALSEKTGDDKYVNALNSTMSRSVFTKYAAREVELGVEIDPEEQGLERIFYNPKKGDTFHHFYRDGVKERVDEIAMAYMDGNGAMWGRPD